MVSHNESEGIEPRNMTKSHWAKDFTIWKPVALHAIKGECVSDVPGSESMAGHSKIHNGTWENRVVLKRSLQQAEEVKRRYDDMVVGLTHSRGVNGVMPIESQEPGTLEGVSGKA